MWTYTFEEEHPANRTTSKYCFQMLRKKWCQVCQIGPGFLVVPVSGPLKNPVLILALSNLVFQIQLSILNLKNLVSRRETQKGRNQGRLFENLIFSLFRVVRSFWIFSIEKKFSKNVKDTYSRSASNSLSDRLKKRQFFFFTTFLPYVHLT